MEAETDRKFILKKIKSATTARSRSSKDKEKRTEKQNKYTGHAPAVHPLECAVNNPNVPQPPKPSQSSIKSDANPTPKKKKSKKKKSPEAKLAAEAEHYALVLEAAHTVVQILEGKHGLPCAVFGSLAARLYIDSKAAGEGFGGLEARCPHDVDLLVSQLPRPAPPTIISSSDSSTSTDPPVSTEPNPDLPSSSPSHPLSQVQAEPEPEPFTPADIKNLILTTNSRNFYLKMPRDPTAEYRVLWYRRSYLGRECKVDILVPGRMDLPWVAKERVTVLEGKVTLHTETAVTTTAESTSTSSAPPGKLSKAPTKAKGTLSSNSNVVAALVPVVPFSLLLLHKLQGWDDHRLATETFKRSKQNQDAKDLKRLMGCTPLTEIMIREGRERLRGVSSFAGRVDGEDTEDTSANEEAEELREELWFDADLFTPTFAQRTRERVREYCHAFPERKDEWKALGFDVSPPPPSSTPVPDTAGTGAADEQNEDEEGAGSDEDVDEIKEEVPRVAEMEFVGNTLNVNHSIPLVQVTA